MSAAFWVRSASTSCLAAVALGAFGAHALKGRLDADTLAVFETGVRYQFYHALGLFGVAWLADRFPSKAVGSAGACFLCGTLLFSGSLYALSLTGARKLGVVTPVGGLLFLTGWGCLALASLRG